MKLKELRIEEMVNIGGGSPLSKKLGYYVGEYMDFTESMNMAFVATIYEGVTEWWDSL